MRYQVLLAESRSTLREGRYRVTLHYRVTPKDVPAEAPVPGEVSLTVTVSFCSLLAPIGEDTQGQRCLEASARGVARAAAQELLTREGGPPSAVHLLIARNSFRRGDLDPFLQEPGRGIEEGDQGDEVGFFIEVSESAQA
ncbi:MAG: hypothetical protein SFU83_06370 [Meiothermus sp.]|nr:hypothetical protein [Meiothermus sp.]